MNPLTKGLLKATASFTGIILGILIIVVAVDAWSIHQEFAQKEEELEKLLLARATYTDVTNAFGAGTVLTNSEAVRLVWSLAYVKVEAIAKARKYPRTIFYMNGANMTYFVFLDDRGKMADFAMGGQ